MTQTPSIPKRLTIHDLLAMPDDGTERWTIHGELRESPPEHPGLPITMRNYWHSDIMSCIAATIKVWSRSQPKPRGTVLCGEAGVVFPPPIDDSFGLDVAYISPEQSAHQPGQSDFFEGIPVLCVEILSKSDSAPRIEEKTKIYREAGVESVWIVNPYIEQVTVYSADRNIYIYGLGDRIPEIAGMPGFSPLVMELFE
jgi:Uma2 family endonuclease